MQIGFVPLLGGSSGGIYQYSLTMLHTLKALKDDESEDEFVLLVDGLQRAEGLFSDGKTWPGRLISLSPPKPRVFLDLLWRFDGEGPHREVWRWLRQRFRGPTSPGDPEEVFSRPYLAQWWRKQGIDLMLYPAPMSLSFEIGIPYIVAIHDLQHRLQPQFPEVSAHGQWQQREYLFRNCARFATLILVDSEAGREDVLCYYGSYGVTPDQVKILPFLPACYLASDISASERSRIREKYKLPERYLFYPAQFWPHKNHAHIVQALERLKRLYGIEIPVVFCGSRGDPTRAQHFRLVMHIAEHVGVVNLIHFLEFVPDYDMSALYASALALVMPTFFGPTNIPPLEAWAFGCPVLTSDIRGIRDQMGDAAILVDPVSVESIAQGIYDLWTDEDLRRTMANRGRQRLSNYTPNEYRRRLTEVLEEAKARMCSAKSS